VTKYLEKQFKGGWIYFGSWFQRFQSFMEGKTRQSRELTTWQQEAERERIFVSVLVLLPL
jgi:hypothetical protein